MVEPRSLTPPSTTTPTTLEVPTTMCRPLTMARSSLGGSQAGGMRLFRSVSQFVLAFLRQTCLTYVCTQILLLPLTRLWSSTCIRALEAPGLYYDACMTYLCFRVVLWYLLMSPWSSSYTFVCMISVRSNRGRHKLSASTAKEMVIGSETAPNTWRIRRMAKWTKVYMIYMLLMCTLLVFIVAPGYLILVRLLRLVTRNRSCRINRD